MAVSDLLDHVGRLVGTYRSAIDAIVRRKSERLELAAVLSFAEHYKQNGWAVAVSNPVTAPHQFVVKTRARGDAHKYSYFAVKKELRALEIRMNLSVVGAWDGGVYCVDVAVIGAGRIPRHVQGQSQALPNRWLVTFGEVKNMTVYPMLLAQFIGIVHEIKPRFLSLSSAAFSAAGHPPPTLVVLGRYSGNSKVIVAAYTKRGVLLHIAEEIDARLAHYARDASQSPLYS